MVPDTVAARGPVLIADQAAANLLARNGSGQRRPADLADHPVRPCAWIAHTSLRSLRVPHDGPADGDAVQDRLEDRLPAAQHSRMMHQQAQAAPRRGDQI
jgi:hypothetical protein